MKVDFSQVLKSLDGKPLKDEAGTAITLGAVCINALLFPHQDEGNLSGDEKIKRLDLALAIHGNPEGGFDLPSEKVAEIKKLINRLAFYGPLVVGQAWKMLEGQIMFEGEKV